MVVYNEVKLEFGLHVFPIMIDISSDIRFMKELSIYIQQCKLNFCIFYIFQDPRFDEFCSSFSNLSFNEHGQKRARSPDFNAFLQVKFIYLLINKN